MDKSAYFRCIHHAAQQPTEADSAGGRKGRWVSLQSG